MREYCSSRKRSRSTGSVASARMATISGRGVITSRTTVSVKSTIDCSSSRPSCSEMTPSPDESESASCGCAADSEQEGRERSEEHTSELQSPCNLVCRLLLDVRIYQ